MTRLADPWAPQPAVVCNFAWYGIDDQPFSMLTYTVDGEDYPPKTWDPVAEQYVVDPRYQASITPLSTPVTFDAIDQFSLGLPKTIVPDGIEVISYQWDLGNGTTATGPQATTSYNYTRPVPDAAATLVVVDSLGRRYSTTHPLNLRTLTPIYSDLGRA